MRRTWLLRRSAPTPVSGWGGQPASTAEVTADHLPRNLVYGVASVVRARWMGVDEPEAETDSTTGRKRKLEFLPTDTVCAATRGNLSPLLKLQGSFLVPRSLVDKLAPKLAGIEPDGGAAGTALGDGGASTSVPAAALGDGGDSAGSVESAASPASPASASSMVAAEAEGHGGELEEVGSSGSQLDILRKRIEAVDGVDFGQAVGKFLASDDSPMQKGQARTVEGLSRARHHTDVTELPEEVRKTFKPLTPDTAPSLTKEEHALFDAVRRGDVVEVRRMLNNGNGSDGNGGNGGGSGSGGGGGGGNGEVDPAFGATSIHAYGEGGVDTSIHAYNAAPPLNPSVPHPRHGATPLHVAAELGASADMLHALVECGAAVDARARNGSTALMWAAGAGHVEAVQVLMELGADPLAVTHTWANDIFSVGSGRSAIHWAAQSGHGEVVELLLQVAPLSACALDEKGMSPTDLAEKELQLSAMSALNHATYEEEWLILDLRLEEQLSRRIEVPPSPSKEDVGEAEDLDLRVQAIK